jgi:hypothetical protein
MRSIDVSIVVLAALLVSASVPVGAAQEVAGCDKFAWPLTKERAWFAAADKVTVTAGGTLAVVPRGAFVVRLQPGGRASFALPPERQPKSSGWFGGAVSLPAVARSGIYQVTLSDEAWIDVVQDGRYARSVGSSGRHDCPGMRKSVRLELEATRFVLQLSGAASDAITVAVSPSE